MSASFFDLLKYAATGIASPDMTHYDKMRALAMAGGSKVQTLTGIPPLTFKADGTPLISLSMLGNGQQQGTPSPQSIIMPTLCGVRTGNLFDSATLENGIYLATNGNKYGNAANGVRAGTKISVSPNTAYTLSAQSSANVSLRIFEWSNGTFTKQTPKYNISGSVSLTVTTDAETTEIAFNIEGENGQYATNIMLNSGSAALPYEPYGWKIPITCAGQTVPVYLGQTQTTRRITKIKLNSLQWDNYTDGNTLLFRSATEIPRISGSGDGTMYCTIYKSYASRANLETLDYGIAPVNAVANNRLCVRDTRYSTASDWLAANGNAELWFINANETIDIVNEPLAKIGDYADKLHSEDAGVTIPTAKGQNTLTVETDLQPSEMTITYKE